MSKTKKQLMEELDQLKVRLAALEQAEIARQQAEEALREHEAYIKLILDNLPIGVSVNSVDPAVTFSYINDNFVRYYRTTREALADPDAFWEAAYEDPVFRKEIRQRVLDDCATDDPEQMHWEDVPITREGAETSFVSARNTPIPGGQLMLSTVWDTTERKRAEAALRESEERFRTTFEQAAVGIAHVALDGRFLRLNQRFCQIVGYSEEELLARTFQDITYPDDLEADLAAVDRLLEGARKTRTDEKRYVRRDGSIVWVRLTSAVRREPDGQPRYFITVIEDISRRKQAEEQVASLMEQQVAINALTLALGDRSDLKSVCATIYERICALMDADFFAVAFYNQDDQTIRASYAVAGGNVLNTDDFSVIPFSEDGGGSQSEVIRSGQPLNIRDLPETVQHNRHLYTVSDDGAMAEGCPQNGTQAVLRSALLVPMRIETQVIGVMQVQSHRLAAYTSADAELLNGLANVAAIAIQNARLYQELEAYSGFLEQAVAERTGDLQAANERLRELDRIKDEFMATAAHELRTPLTSIRGFSEILLTRDLDKDRHRQYLETINQQSTHLAQIIDDLLDLSRLEAGRGLEIKSEPVEMRTLIDGSLRPFIDTAPNHHFQLRGVAEAPPVKGDAFRLNQVISNLLSNAVKYSPDGGNVTVHTSIDGRYLTVRVEDEGIGLTPEQQIHLFEKFYRADTSGRSGGGTGLGLTICKVIVEGHGGHIWVESEPGAGSTVSFTLPLLADHPL